MTLMERRNITLINILKMLPAKNQKGEVVDLSFTETDSYSNEMVLISVPHLSLLMQASYNSGHSER